MHRDSFPDTRLRAPLRAVIAAVVVFALASAMAPVRACATGEPWLLRLNELRASAGLPAATGDLPGEQGRWLHSRYQAMNGQLCHSEDPSNPWYTAEGAQHTGNCCAAVGGADAIDCWATAPYHATILLQPGVQSFGLSTFEQDGRAASTLECGWDWAAMRTSAAYPVRWPGPGSTVPYTSYWGGESPDPMAGSGYTNPIGLPIIVMFDSAKSFSDSRLSCDGVELEHFVRRSGSSTAFIIPRRPLQHGKTYDVEVTASGVKFPWSFAVGPRRETEVTISAPEHAVGRSATLSIRVTDGGLPSAKPLALERSTDGVTWQHAGTVVTSSITGAGSIRLGIASMSYFRAHFAGDDMSGPSVSAAVRVDAADVPATRTPHRLALATLQAASLRFGRAAQISGTLLPRHTRASTAVRIQAFRIEKGRWVLRGSWRAATTNAAPERFSARVILPSRGAWRIRAVAPADSAHVWGASGYKYLTAR